MQDTRTHQSDPFDLRRFVDGQRAFYSSALAELEQGRKRTHWIWFIFPQVGGLGHSSMAHYYGICSRAEASAYLKDDLLGPRLRNCVKAVLRHTDKTAHEIFGSPDDLKFRSSMTLFDNVENASLFATALDRFYESRRDEATLTILNNWDAASSAR